ncbi:MAG: cobalamin biosynthesis protein CobQ, partial [Hyphomonadaceae bacterium]
MMTQTHLLIAAALLNRPGHKKRNIAVLTGALIPDAAIYLLFVYGMITGIPQQTLWRETYWLDSWQYWVTAGNSLPLYLALLIAALFIAAPKDGRPRWQSLPALFAIAAITHLAGDFPVHSDDAHIHFWPFTEWRFNSPVSYWDRDHHAGIF